MLQQNAKQNTLKKDGTLRMTCPNCPFREQDGFVGRCTNPSRCPQLN